MDSLKGKHAKGSTAMSIHLHQKVMVRQLRKPAQKKKDGGAWLSNTKALKCLASLGSAAVYSLT